MESTIVKNKNPDFHFSDLPGVWWDMAVIFRGRYRFPISKDRCGYSDNKMTNGSFRNACLRNCTFCDNIELESVLLPSNGSCFTSRNFTRKLEKLLALAEGRIADVRKDIQEYVLFRPPTNGQETNIVCKKDVESEVSQEAADVILTVLQESDND